MFYDYTSTFSLTKSVGKLPKMCLVEKADSNKYVWIVEKGSNVEYV